jgi:hypothetical protein
MISHSREGGIAKTGVEAYIGLRRWPEGGVTGVTHNPVVNAHGELVEPFHKELNEPFDRLRVNEIF